MKKLLNKVVFCAMMFVATSSFASFVFNKGSHSFIFNEDMSIYITPTTEGFDADGLGYYLNDDDTFYAISESDLGNALNFKAGDEVRIVRKHNENATHKTNLFKVDDDDYMNNIYKIAGKGNGDVQFKITATKVSGQPLPSYFITMGLGGLCLYFFLRKRNK